MYIKDRQKKLVRMVKIEHLFYQNPGGLTVEQIAETCGVSKKTIYRDLADLEESIYLPIYKDQNRLRIDPHSFIPLTVINMHEALCIFMAIRLMSRYSQRYDPFVASTFQKLNSTVPSPLRDQVQKTLDWMLKLPQDKRSEVILNTIAQAMVKSQRVKITYQSLAGAKPTERIIQPYCIEPAAVGHANYVIAYCQKVKDIRTFKIERVLTAQLMEQSYSIPLDFDANKFFSSGWGIVSEGEMKIIKMHLKPSVAKITQEVIWHPSQKLEMCKDGEAVMTVNVVDTPEFYNWILGWGDEIEVLSPAEVRKNVIEKAKKTIQVYA
jgi:predicted DNA-binding transcriptional regulator YafY